MKKMVILGAGLLLAAGAVFLAVANKPLSAEEALLLANVEAIAQNESGGGGECPDPYDVRDHMFDFGNPIVGSFGVESDGTITIQGVKIPVSFGAGATVTVTYHVGNCRLPATGTCCPGDRIGEVNILGMSF